jgi:hypothetical protein
MVGNGEGKSRLQYWSIFANINSIMQEIIDKQIMVCNELLMSNFELQT